MKNTISRISSIIKLYICAFTMSMFLAPNAFAQTYGDCTVSKGDPNLGTHSSTHIKSSSVTGSGSGGLKCTSVLDLLFTHYIKVRAEVVPQFLTHEDSGSKIPFTIYAIPSGTPMGVGSEHNFTSTTILGLFSSTGGNIPMYFSTSPQSNINAGVYKATVKLRWYFSVCTGIATELDLGILGKIKVCSDYSKSPGINADSNPVNWGSGVQSDINIELTVTADCTITTSPLNFGSAPFVASFNPVTGSVEAVCTKGSTYKVGLSNGGHYLDNWRRMKHTGVNSYLQYQIYKSPGSTVVWGDNTTLASSADGSIRENTSADVNAATTDGINAQKFIFGAKINPSQTTPPAGDYKDTITVKITF